MNNTTPAQQILEITEIKLSILESFPPQLNISVSGTVGTTGWSNPMLVPYTYIQAPPDGIYDFDFVATPPDGIVAQVVTPISVNYVLPDVTGVKGIRVHASSNSKVALVDQSEVSNEIAQA